MAACDKLAGAAVQGANAADLARIFAETAGKTVILLDPDLRPQAQAARTGSAAEWDPGDASLAKLLRLLAAERRPLRVPPVPGSSLAGGCLATPVIVGETILGYLICYEELGIYRLLLQVGDMQQLRQFAEDVLGPLLDYDARHKVDLVGTLSIYLNQHESLKQTARVLLVHVNTVTYRIQRIEQLTSLDLANPDHRLSAHVATKIIESQRPPRRQTLPGR
jgi:PucR C-terminal helix-turn-helix domain